MEASKCNYNTIDRERERAKLDRIQILLKKSWIYWRVSSPRDGGRFSRECGGRRLWCGGWGRGLGVGKLRFQAVRGSVFDVASGGLREVKVPEEERAARRRHLRFVVDRRRSLRLRSAEPGGSPKGLPHLPILGFSP